MPNKRDNDEERRERVEHQVREIRKRAREPIEFVPRDANRTVVETQDDCPPRSSRTVNRDRPAS